jgi:hypothetical protein
MLLVVFSTSARAQVETGNLYGTVVDEQGSSLPGVTFTLTGQGAPQVFVTNAQGQFRFLGLAPGAYQVKAELEGFSTVEYPNIVINVGRNTSIEVTLASAVEDVITVTAETPLLDERRISTGQTVSETELEKTPTARDPWVILQQTPGVLTDRINVGGNEAGQQSEFVTPGQRETPRFTGDPMEAFGKVLAGNDLFEPGTAKGVSGQDVEVYTYRDPATGKDVTIMMGSGWDAALPPPDAPPDALPPPPVPDGVTFDNFFLATPRDYISPFSSRGPRGDFMKPDVTAPGVQILAGDTPEAGQAVWSVDGVVITDMAALGSSPSYYDFDSFEEIQSTTSGAINDLVVSIPGGTTIIRGGLDSPNATEYAIGATKRLSGRGLISRNDWQEFYQGNRVVQVEDYGAELGGPIIKDKLWIWGSYGTQEVDLLTLNPSAGREWNYESITEIAKILTVDANGNDATSPDFDPNNVVQYGFQPICRDVPGFDVFAPAGSGTPTDCTSIASSLRNTIGTGVLQGFVNDPFGGPTIRIRQETTWNQAKFGDDPTAYKIEDTHIFSSNFYLTGLYSIVDGGFQLVPQGGFNPSVQIGSDVLPPGNDAYAGWIPSSNLSQYTWDRVPTADETAGEAPQAPAGGTGVVPFTMFDREDFTECPNGVWFGAFGVVDHTIKLGNDSGFTPFEPRKVDCDDFEWDTIVPRVGLTYALGQEQRTLLRASYSRFADQLATRGDSRGVWFFGGTYFDRLDETDEQPFQDRFANTDRFTLDLGVRYDDEEEGEAPNYNFFAYNPTFVSSFSTLFSDQNFGARFQGQQAGGEQQGEGGAAPLVIDAADLAVDGAATPTLYFESLGVSTGEAFEVRVLGADLPVVVNGAVAVEPVQVPPGDRARIEEEVGRSASGPAFNAIGYCLNFAKNVPQAGTIYRIAGPEAQRAFQPIARILEAADRVREAGRLATDADPEGYFQFISQWAIWTKENGFDMEAFGDAFVEHVKRNIEQAGQTWADEVEGEVRRHVPQRWRDIQQVLEAAGS